MDAARRRRLSAYLEGTLPEDERRRLEAEYAADDELFEELIEVENDRLDSAARHGQARAGTWPPADAPDAAPWEDRVGFARALAGVYRLRRGHEPIAAASAAARPRRGYMVQTGLAAAALFLAAGLASLFVTNGRLRREVQALRNEQDDLRRRGEEVARGLEALGAQVHEPRAQDPAPPPAVSRTAPRVVSLRLLPGGARGGGPGQELRLDGGPDVIQLELGLEQDEYPRYRAAVHRAEGNRVWMQGRLRSRPGAAGERLIVLRLPASSLPAGDYVVRLMGATAAHTEESVDAYHFTAAWDPRPPR
jgi:anti-sigma factor RsiW